MMIIIEVFQRGEMLCQHPYGGWNSSGETSTFYRKFLFPESTCKYVTWE